MESIVHLWLWLAGGAIGVAAVLWFARRGVTREAPRRVLVENDSIVAVAPDGTMDRIGLNDLVRVEVETNDAGPVGDDVWFVLSDRAGRRFVYPLNAEGSEEATALLTQLPGFELRGMDCTENRTFRCWPLV